MTNAYLTRPLAPRPELSPPPDWTFPAPEEHTLPNGLRVLVHHLPGQHVATAALVLDLPLDAEPRALEGIATITARALDDGTVRHPGTSYADALHQEGAVLSMSVTQAGLQIFADSPTSRLHRVLPLFAEALMAPALEDADVYRHVQLRLGQIDQVLSRQTSLAPLMMRHVLFDESARAARLSGGEPSTLEAITPDDVRAFHAEHFVPSRSTLVLGGDFSPGSPMGLVERVLGPWEGSGSTPPAHHRPATTGPATLVVDQPGAVQVTFAMGGPGVDRLSAQWPALRLATHAMGGAFWSRLNRVLREDRGYTYGISMGLTPFRVGGLHQITASTRPEVAGDAIAETISIARLAEEAITDQEVVDSQTYTHGVTPLSFATAMGVVDRTSANVLNGLPLTYVNDFQDLVRRVDAEAATRAYRDVVRPDEWVVVAAGDATRLTDALVGAGLPAPVVMEPRDLVH